MILAGLVLSAWKGSGMPDTDPYRPQVVDDYPAITTSRDITARSNLAPPTPNHYILAITAPAAVIVALEADANYGVGAVLYHDLRPPDAAMVAAEFAAIVAWMQAHGATAGNVTAAIGAALAGRTRRQVAVALWNWLKALP